MLLGNDEPEEAELAQLVDELGRHLAGGVPGAEFLAALPEQRIDGVDHGAQDLALARLHLRVGEHHVLLDLPGAERAHEADALVGHRRRLRGEHSAPAKHSRAPAR